MCQNYLLSFHTLIENVEINFGAAPTGIRQCNQPVAILAQSMTAEEPTTFRVRIGPSGGPRGYESITGEIETICLKLKH